MEAEAEEEHPDDKSQEEANDVEEPTQTRPTRNVKPVDQLTYSHNQTKRSRRNMVPN